MDCETARDAMLECGPAELEGRGDNALAAHLRSCEVCRRRAGILLAELGALDGALAALSAAPCRPAAEPAGRPSGVPSFCALPTDARGARGLAAGVSGNARWQRLWRLAAPVAVAAALAVLVLAWPRGAGPVPGADRPTAAAGSPAAATAASGRPELRVRVPSDARVAVFQTRDPSVAVVWFFPVENGG